MPAIGIFFSLHSQICSYVSVKLGKPTTLANQTSNYLFKNAKSCLLVKSGLWLFASLRSSYRLKPGAQLCRQHGFTLRLCYSWKRPTLLIPFPNVNKPDMVLVHSSLLWVVTSPVLIQDMCWNEAGGLSCLTQWMFCPLISGIGEQFYKANWNEVYCAACAEWDTSVCFRKLCSAQKCAVGVKVMVAVMERRDKSGDAAPCSFVYSFFALCFLVSISVFVSTACHHPAFFLPLWATSRSSPCSGVCGFSGVPWVCAVVLIKVNVEV